jgi:hypothetical protein
MIALLKVGGIFITRYFIFSVGYISAGLENIFLFLAAKSKTKNFLSKSNIKLPAHVDLRERMVPHIVMNFNLDTRQSLLVKRFWNF